MLNGIYCIENKENGMMYIGKGVRLKTVMNSPHKTRPYIYNALRYYGNDSFTRYVIEYCDKNMLAERERAVLYKNMEYNGS